MEDEERKLVYTVAEVQHLLGIGRASVYEGLRTGTIPSLKVGRRYLIPRASLQRWLEQTESLNEQPHLN